MRVSCLILVFLLVAAGCTHRTVIPYVSREKAAKQDGRYEYFLAEALRLKYEGNTDDAVKLFEKCKEIDRTRSVPWFELAQIYSAAGMGEASLKNISMAARLEPGNYWYQLAGGSLFTQYGQKDSAIVYFTRALRADSRSIEVNSVLAGLYAETGQTDKADSLFVIIDRHGELNDDMFLIMISGLIMKGNLTEAAARTLRLIERKPAELKYSALLADIYFEDGLTEKSDSIYREIIEKNPDDIESQLLYLMSLVYKKEYSGISLFLNKIFESQSVGRDRKVGLAGRLIADTAFVRSNPDAFEESLKILEKNYPGDEEILSMRPGLYETEGRTDEAITRYEELVNTVRPGFFLSERLILLYAGKREYRKLYDLAASYSRENNRSILGKVYYAIAAMELREYDIAENELNKALILAGNNSEIKVQVLSMMGDLKYRMKQLEESYRLYEEALKISPEEPLILNNYAYFLAEGNRDLKNALRMASKVMEIEGNNDTYIDTYAWVLYKMGKFRKAYREMLKIFSRENERDPEILEHMGYILKAMKRCNDAVIYWRSALEKDSTKIYLVKEIEECSK